MRIDKNSYVYKNHIEKYDPKSKKTIEAKKKEAAEKRKNWWKNNWIGFLGLIVATFALLVAIGSLTVAIIALKKM